ncbi:MAG: hypothetical protein ACT6FG_00020 [Methanosarcinaceae archaeon]
MTVKYEEDMKKTSFSCPLSIIYAIQDHNSKNPDEKFNTSEVCRKALREELKKRGIDVKKYIDVQGH